jgi:hypothetical protein
MPEKQGGDLITKHAQNQQHPRFPSSAATKRLSADTGTPAS